MRRFAIPTLGVLLFSLYALLISGCSKKEAKPAANPRLEKSGQLLAAEPVVPVAKDSSESVMAEGEDPALVQGVVTDIVTAIEQVSG